MILLGLGSNLHSLAGDPSATMAAALERLSDDDLRILRLSSCYESKPVGPEDQPPYLNAVAELSSTLDPEALLERLHEIEAAFGRRRTRRWGPRTLDLDLLDYEGKVLPDRERWYCYATSRVPPDCLVLPHPRLHARRFVLEPLAELDPDWRHPVLGRTAAALLADVAEQPVRRI